MYFKSRSRIFCENILIEEFMMKGVLAEGRSKLFVN